MSMQQLSIPKLIMRRLADDWKLLLSVFVGITIATTLAAGTPVYLNSLGQLSFHVSLDRLPAPVIDIGVSASNIPLTEKSLQSAEQLLSEAIDRHISPIYAGHESYLKGGISAVGLPTRPLPEGGGTGIILSRGYFQHLSNLELHSRFVEGRMATNVISVGDLGPELEAVISAQTAMRFNLNVGDILFLSPAVESASVVSAEIVGILEPADASEELWASAGQILDPVPLTTPTPLLVQADPLEPPLALFVTEDVMFEVGGDLELVAPFGRDTYLRGRAYFAGHPERPLPEGGGEGIYVLLGFLQHLSNLAQHARFTDGRMAGTDVSTGPHGPEMEAVVSSQTAKSYFLSVGDVVTVSPTLGAKPVISAHIVGIMEPADPSEAYWTSAALFLNPTPVTTNPPLLVQLDTDQVPVGLFVTQEALIEAVGQTYPGSLVKPTWFVLVDKGRLKDLSVEDARRRLKEFGDEVTEALPGASASTGIVLGLTEAGEKRSFFSRVPLLLILVVMVATVLVFLFMMVSYLVRMRENDSALLRTRGIGSFQLLRLYTVEGVVMTAVAVAMAPLLAMAAVAVMGLLPPFREMTGGGPMPVMLEPIPFLVAIAVGLLCLAIFAIPSMVSARGGVLLQRIQASRPATLPLFHRYYLDVGLLVLGGLAFWELQQRGHLVSGGLFKEVDVNETLLLAPVLLLVVVALVFVRFFPMVMRFISGESPALVHVLAALTALALAGGIVFRETREGDVLASIGPVTLALAVGAVYWATARTRTPVARLAGLLVQAGLVAGFLTLEPLDSGDALFTPGVALISIVPAQLAFLLFGTVTRASPVWLLMGLRHMSRNPLQYTWLVLLLVLVTGLAILATTVGGTLERSQSERLQYDVPTDMRVSFSSLLLGGPQAVRERILDIPGVTVASMAFRGSGIVAESTPQVLALEPGVFADISWYRDDFSDRSLGEVMNELQPTAEVERIAIPEGSTSLGLWVKPLEFNPFLSMFFEVEDSRGALQTIFLGNLGPTEWTLMRGEVPAELKGPLHLVSVLIFQPGGLETPGTISVDDIHATIGLSGEEQVLEDFEGEMRWSPVATAALSSERMTFADDAYQGIRAGSFSFGNTTFRGLQGFYYSKTEGPLPVVLSSSLATATDHKVGDTFNAQIGRRWIPVVIKGIVDYFPTLKPDGGGFVVTDLDGLLGSLNVLLDFYKIRPNEAFVAHTPEAHDAVREGISEGIGRFGEINDGTEQLEALRMDPYITAGWKPMALLSPGIGVLAAAIGYVAYLLSFARRAAQEVGSLQSIGLSRMQLLGLLGFEHLTIAAIGLGLGSWAGFQMSRLMVSPLAVTETGDPVVPPFVLTTDWGLMLATLGALVAVLLAALVVLNRGIGHLDLHTMARVGQA